jgi:hypothetical protein
MLDQPSQVYFPRKLAGRKTEMSLAEDDRVRVHAIFSEMARVTKSTNGLLQLIVVDHASKDVWGDIPDIHFVDDWRGDRRLIPRSWLTNQAVAETSKEIPTNPDDLSNKT